MKKFILAAAVLAAFSTSGVAENNYKPEAMSVATEINYSFDGANTNEGFQLPEYGAKVRLFLNDNWVVRLNLGLGVDTQKGTTYYEAFLILPGYTMPSDNRTGNLNITLDSTGTQLIFTRSGMGSSSATDFGYLALG